MWNKPLQTVGISILGILFAGNVFFIRRLVDKIDSLETIAWQLRQDVAILKIVVETRKANDSEIQKRPNFQRLRKF